MIQLDESARFSTRGILRSEEVHGYGHQSPGGGAVTREFIRDLGLPSTGGIRVLDVGCGTGGAAMHLATAYEAEVTGIDTAPAMIDICRERCRDAGVSATFLQVDSSAADVLPAAEFDLVWARDCVMYMPDKGRFWANAYRWLAENGQLLVVDFGRGEAASTGLDAYMADCGYRLQSQADYHHAAGEAGFTEVRSRDLTDRFIELNRHDLRRLQAGRDGFLSRFSAEEFRYLVERWERKIDLACAGELAWHEIRAHKGRLG